MTAGITDSALYEYLHSPEKPTLSRSAEEAKYGASGPVTAMVTQIHPSQASRTR